MGSGAETAPCGPSKHVAQPSQAFTSVATESENLLLLTSVNKGEAWPGGLVRVGISENPWLRDGGSRKPLRRDGRFQVCLGGIPPQKLMYSSHRAAKIADFLSVMLRFRRDGTSLRPASAIFAGGSLSNVKYYRLVRCSL